MTLSREIPIDPEHAALLFIDVQNLTANREAETFTSLSETAFTEAFGWFFQQLDGHVLANMQSSSGAFGPLERK